MGYGLPSLTLIWSDLVKVTQRNAYFLGYRVTEGNQVKSPNFLAQPYPNFHGFEENGC
jgi:hypothetical protein